MRAQSCARAVIGLQAQQGVGENVWRRARGGEHGTGAREPFDARGLLGLAASGYALWGGLATRGWTPVDGTVVGVAVRRDLRDGIDNATLLVAPRYLEPESVDPGLIREAIRLERKLAIGYRNEAGETSTRTIWPICIAFFESVRIVTAWCELRDDFRNFRIDRIETLESLAERYPRRRDAMMREWRTREGISRL